MTGHSISDAAIDLIIIDPSLNNAETYISSMRNAGLAVHATRIDQQQVLIDALTKGHPDMIFYSCGTQGIDLSQALKLSSQKQPDTPFIIICGEEDDPSHLLQAMRDGARDVVSADDHEHLQLVVTREYRDFLVRKKANNLEVRLLEVENRCSALIESSRDAIAYVHEGMHIHANPAYLDLFGYVDMEDIEGLPIMDMADPGCHKYFREFLRSLDRDQASSCTEINCRGSDGRTFNAHLEFSPAEMEGEPCIQVIVHDQSQENELEEKIQQLSTLDAHTGLHNRSAFMQRLEEAWEKAQAKKESFGLIYVMVDKFPKLRSAIGINTSDAILKEIATVMTKAVGKTEFPARFGDHSFIVLSRHSPLTEIETLAAGLCTAINEHLYETPGQFDNPTCSIGIAYSEEEASTQEFINHAYFACETARDNGGNQISVYDVATPLPGYQEKQNEKGSETDISELIHHALEQDRLRLVFQPVVSLQGDTRENYAVLMRLLDDNDEEILPTYFIDEAEKSGQMAELDKWVIKHAIEELGEQRAKGRKVNFLISISGGGIKDQGLLLWICDHLRDYKAKGAWLTFQISESNLRAHMQRAKSLIAGLKKLKCQIAISDFGLATKSEPLLKRLPIDYVKFEPSLMENLAGDQEHQKKLHDLNELAQTNDVKTIASAVEDANSLAILWTVGVNYIQGYFVQEPSESITYDFGGA